MQHNTIEISLGKIRDFWSYNVFYFILITNDYGSVFQRVQRPCLMINYSLLKKKEQYTFFTNLKTITTALIRPILFTFFSCFQYKWMEDPQFTFVFFWSLIFDRLRMNYEF